MKKFYIILAILSMVCCGCKQRIPKKLSDIPDWMAVPDSIPILIQDEEQNMEEDELSYVNVAHQWKDLDDSVYLTCIPVRETIENWKRDFERANPTDSVWRMDLARFKDVNHYLTVTDFIELWHKVAAEIDVPQTEWRLLQWDSNPTSMPKGGFAKVVYIRDLYESLMCYETGSQWDMTFYGWLWTDFLTFYNKLLHREICSRVSQNVRVAMEKEWSTRERFQWKESDAFQKMQGDSLGGGSSFPYSVGMFGKESLEAAASANEIFLFTLMENSRMLDVAEGFSPELVIQEYEHFAEVIKNTAEEYDGCYPVAEKLKVLFEDKNAWRNWMIQRTKVSSLLAGSQKKAFDVATGILCRKKLILLKNRYNIDDAFCPSYISNSLAHEDWTKSQILGHNLEELLSQ